MTHPTDRQEQGATPSNAIKEVCFWGGGAEVTYADGTKEIHRTDAIHEYLLNELKKKAEAALASLAEGWIPAGWRYRELNTGIVTLTEQPPDRVSDLDRYEVVQVFARNPLPPAPEVEKS